ncbi:MAG: glycosyltransferase family 39 protein [Syntrophobacteraceae bacterium]|jgi:4-amino-4-deoxy-L-arabinose transferase-like glycosyltransferase|nr:glycosyltransferase family 39 protein [Syntrophobacteraceae bacterium]
MSPRRSKTQSRDGLLLAALLSAGLLFSLWRLGSTALFDLDEGGYAEIAREMLILDDWIIPRLNFVRLLDKPPLLYWLTAVSFKLFGVSEFSARLPVALSITGIMAICFGVGRRFFGSLAGFLAAAVFATSAACVVFETGRQLQPDMVFTLFLAAALAALLLARQEPENRQDYLRLGYAAMALAVMTKGLIGLVFPVATAVGYAVLTREPGMFRRFVSWSGLAIFLALTLPWHLAAEWRSPGFLRFYILDVHVLRFFNEGSIASSMNALPLAGLWAGTALILFPWTFHLVWVMWDDAARLARGFGFRREGGGREGGSACGVSGTLSRAVSDGEVAGEVGSSGRMARAGRWIGQGIRWRGEREADHATLWLWLWAGSVLGFFSIASFRLFYYGLPALPALAVLTGRFWSDAISAAPTSTPWYRWKVLTGAVPLLLVASAILAAGLMPDLWRESLGREMYGMVDPNLMGYDDGVVTASKVVSLPSWEDLSTLALHCGGFLTLLAAVAVGAAAARRYAWTFACIVLSMVVLRYFSQVGTEIFEPYVSTRSLGTTIAASHQPGERIVMDGLYEDVASVTFYSGQGISMVHGVKKDLAFGARFPEAAGTFLEEKDFLDLWNSGARVYLLTDFPSSLRPGRDEFYARLTRHYVTHSGSMKLYTNIPLPGRVEDGGGAGTGEVEAPAAGGSTEPPRAPDEE